MDEKRLVKISKYLARHLRHEPERLGIALDRGGWVEIDELLRACERRNFALTRTELDEVVARSDKQRFAVEGTRIRANQGHSVAVDLGLDPVIPPPLLFHGTGERNLPAILATGLQPRGRHHVHLHADRDHARRVGSRHGRPVVLEIDAARMAADGHPFLHTANDVWLAQEVNPRYFIPPP